MVDYYKVLDLPRTATEIEIKKAYKKLALKWHPDKNPDNLDEANIRFRELSEAYEVLSDEKKRRVYDQYGKDGLLGDRGHRSSRQYHTHSHDFDYFDISDGFPFVFRPPEEVFFEFFGSSSPFADLFKDVHNHSSNNRGHHHHQHSSYPHLTSAFAAPMVNYSMMDILSPSNSFTSFTSFNGSGRSGMSSGTNGAFKSTSTTTQFLNGKKLMTKLVYENGKETVFSYENDVLKSKTVNGVAQKLSSIKK